MAQATDRHIENLKRFFRIRGDGVAQIRINEAAADEQFRRTLEQMKNLKIDDQREAGRTRS